MYNLILQSNTYGFFLFFFKIHMIFFINEQQTKIYIKLLNTINKIDINISVLEVVF